MDDNLQSNTVSKYIYISIIEPIKSYEIITFYTNSSIHDIELMIASLPSTRHISIRVVEMTPTVFVCNRIAKVKH